MNPNLQPGIHPDADQLSVFVEGAATAREQEKMLAHLGECAECRKAVFLMQSHEETQRTAAMPEQGWIWRWLVPVGLPATVLGCGLIAVLVHIRPHGTTETPQQIASARPPESERHATTVAPSSSGLAERGAPTANADRAASINSELVARSGGRRSSPLPNAASTNVSRRDSRVASDLNLPTVKGGRATGGVAPQPMATAPAASVQTADSALAQSTLNSADVTNLPLNGRKVTELQQLQTADTKGAASENTLAKKNELPALLIQGASTQDTTLAGISGRITDRTGAFLAGVTLTLHDAAGKTRQTTTGADGSFHLTHIPAGQYQLTATASGFKTSQQSIELKPSELAMLQPVLDMGTASEAVEVEATSGAASVETESAKVSDQLTAEMNGVSRASAVPSGLPVAETVSHGKWFLSLDDAGNLFLSRNKGKKWKKIKPQWAGKAIRLESTSGSLSETAHKPKDGASSAAGEGAIFLLTTDGGTVLRSKDGAHWHQQ